MIARTYNSEPLPLVPTFPTTVRPVVRILPSIMVICDKVVRGNVFGVCVRTMLAIECAFDGPSSEIIPLSFLQLLHHVHDQRTCHHRGGRRCYRHRGCIRARTRIMWVCGSRGQLDHRLWRHL